MYPLHMMTEGPVVGFAVAANEGEHTALTARGYLPAFEGPPAAEVVQPQAEAEAVDAPQKRGPGRPRKQP